MSESGYWHGTESRVQENYPSSWSNARLRGFERIKSKFFRLFIPQWLSFAPASSCDAAVVRATAGVAAPNAKETATNKVDTSMAAASAATREKKRLQKLVQLMVRGKELMASCQSSFS